MATRLPSGAYRTQVLIGTENGKRVYKSFVADTANAANLAALQFKAEHGDKNARAFSKIADEYLVTISKTLSVNTIRAYKGILHELKAHHRKFCSTPISSIDRQILQALLNAVATDHSPKTVRNYYAFISSVLHSQNIRPPEVVLPKKKRPELNIPDKETLSLVFKAVEGTELEVPVKLGATVPMREGEIFGTDISDLDENDVLHIHRSMARGTDGKLILKQPKTLASDRYVKLAPELAAKIREQGYICNMNFKSFSRTFSRALKKAGFEHFRFHDLRHAFVSIAHAAGFADAYIMARGGWSTPYTMTNVYRHVLDSERQRVEQEINSLFSDLL